MTKEEGRPRGSDPQTGPAPEGTIPTTEDYTAELVDAMGDPLAPKGSPDWALWMRLQAQEAIRLHRLDRERLAKKLAFLRTWGGYEAFGGPYGMKLRSWDRFVRVPPPWGLGLNHEEALQLAGIETRKSRRGNK